MTTGVGCIVVGQWLLGTERDMWAVLIPVALGVILLCLLGPHQAAAVPLNSWEHYCFTDENEDGRVCTTELRAVYDDQEFVFYFARGPRGPVPLVVMGTQETLREMTVKVDDQAPLSTENCETGMCYFDVAKSKKLLRQFRRGRSARILILGSGSQVLFDDEITLIGFTAAFRRY